jgi:hypothetical protein
VDYDDHGLTAMPKLVGGPRYSRPPVSVAPRIERPPNPDDLPLVAERTPEDEALAAELGVDAQAAAVLAVPTYATVQTVATASAATSGLEPAHPNGTWTAGSGTSAVGTPSPRRGFGGLFRGRSGGSGAS